MGDEFCGDCCFPCSLPDGDCSPFANDSVLTCPPGNSNNSSCKACSPCGPCCFPCFPKECCPSPPLKKCRSCEIRGGILYTGCECIRRNGLQQDCPRRLCRGNVACLTSPKPQCCPSQHALRLQVFPPLKSTNNFNPCCSSLCSPPVCIPCTMPSPSCCMPCPPRNICPSSPSCGSPCGRPC